MQEIFNYDINNQKYVCYLKDGNIIFGKVIDNKIDTNLNEDELRQITSVYMFFVNNQKQSERIKDIKLQDTTFEVYYNSLNDFYTFKQLDHLDNKSFLPILNNAFNNKEDKLYLKNNRLNRFIKVSLLVGMATITVNVSAFLNTNSLPVTFKDYDDFEKGFEISSMIKDDIETYNNSEYKWEDIKEVIDNNPNLTNLEKEFLYGFRYQIEDNLEYIDIDIIKRNLSELKFVYHPYDPEKEEKKAKEREKEGAKEDIIVTGSYTNMGTNRNQIDFYGIKQYECKDFNSVPKRTAEHEVGHLLTKYSKGYNYPGFYGDVKYTQYYLEDKHFDKLAEAVNELFAREYSNVSKLKEEERGYTYLMPAMYVLCEVLEDEVIRCYNYNCNLYYVTNALHKMGIPLEDIHAFYDAMNVYATALGSEDEKERNDLLASIAAKKAYHYLNEFYYTKYGINIEDNIALSASFHGTYFVGDDYTENIERQLGMFDITYAPKTYFNSNSNDKSDFPKVTGLDEFGHQKVVVLDGKSVNIEDSVVK